MKYQFLTVLIFSLFFITVYGQEYSNEWIDFDKTYYKVKLAKDGLYRIPYATLEDTGIPMQGNGFQLFYQGVQLPVYVTTEGTFADGDYLEFYGKKNDGSFDTALFENPEWQLTPDNSLFTDTATYFLTWDDSGFNARYVSFDNDITAPPPAETHFMHRSLVINDNVFNSGIPFRAAGVNNNFSDFESGEGFVSSLILGGQSREFTIPSPALFEDGSDVATIHLKVVGRSDDFAVVPDHHLEIRVGGIGYINDTYEGETVKSYTFNPAFSHIGSEETTIEVSSLGDLSTLDRNSVAFISLTYPRSYDFDGERSFTFSIPNDGHKYFEISNFNGGSAPVLYDLTVRQRIIPELDGGIYKIMLPNSSLPNENRELLLTNTTSFLTLNTVEKLEVVTFTNFSETAFQGDYLIITHPALRIGLTDWVTAYHDYRSSPEGGGFNVKTIEIDQLYDQFAYGIAKHPLAVRNFINYAMENWNTSPGYLLLLGKSIGYAQTTNNPTAYNQCLVPSFGNPPSDAMLVSSSNTDYRHQISVGRVPAATGNDVRKYLDKVMTYELNQNDPFCNEDTEWRKKVLFLVNSTNMFELEVFPTYFPAFQSIVESREFGAVVPGIYADQQMSSEDSLEVLQHIAEGSGLIVYMGHSNGNEWAFDLPSPSAFGNNGKYPVIVSNACFAGNIHFFNPDGNSLAEQYLFTENAGAIAYTDNVGFGFPTLLNNYTTEFLEALTTNRYGHGVGSYMQQAVNELFVEFPDGETENGTKMMCQTFTLAGDPAISAVPADKSNFTISVDEVDFINPYTGFPIFSHPANITEVMPYVDIRAIYTNLGRAINDSVTVDVIRVFPDADFTTVATTRVPVATYRDTIFIRVHNDLPDESGLNSFIVHINPDNAVAEDCLGDNSATRIANVQSNCSEYPEVDLGNAVQVLPEGGNITLDAGNNGTAYEWSTGETSPVITVSTPGVYSVIVTDASGCQNIDVVEVVMLTGIDQTAFSQSVKLYPNPARDVVYVKFLEHTSKAAHLQVLNMQGKLMLEKKLEERLSNLDVGSFSSGLYLVKLVSGDDIIVKKLILD